MTGSQPNRPLADLVIGLSVSETDESGALGFTAEEVNRSVRLVAEALLGQGARLAFGHDWRPGGVMADIFDFALSYRATARPGPGTGRPLIFNFVPSPGRTALSDDERARYSELVHVVEVGAPPAAAFAEPTLLSAARSLTHMREKLVELADARLCIGGRTTGSSGWFAGVAEEAYLTLRAGKPLYLSGLFEGASADVIRALEGHSETALTTFTPRQDVADALRLEPGAAPYPLGKTLVDELGGMGLDSLSRANRLTPEENRALFRATSLPEVVGWLLEALKRLQRAQNGASTG